jgi:GTPase SAR1 family protein
MGIILVYDCTEEQTFNNISNWLKQIDQHASSNVAKVLIANKCDRSDKVIETERGKALAEAHGLQFFETSAKSGLNVHEVFQHIAKVIIREKIPAGTNNMGLNGGGNHGKNGLGTKSIKMEATDKKDAKSEAGGCCK